MKGDMGLDLVVVSPDAARAAAVSTALQRTSDRFVVRTATPGTVRERLAEHDADCVLADVTNADETATSHLGTARPVVRFTTGEPPEQPSAAESSSTDADPVVVDPKEGDVSALRSSVEAALDVTEDRDAERRRQQELARYETIIETAPFGLFVLDEEGVITWANDVYASKLGIPRSELVGTPFRDLLERGYYEEAVVEGYIEQVRTLLSSKNDVEQTDYLIEIHTPDGTTHVQEAYISLLPLEDGEFQGTVVAYRDITKQRAYERELERQNERLDRFASMVSHDLRNPLSVARGRLDLARETGDPEHLDHIAEAHDRMQSLVDGLLSLARGNDALDDPRPVSLDNVSRAAWQSIDADGAVLDVDGEVTLSADPDRLRQAFENLFRNSVEHGSTSPDSRTHQDAVEYGSTNPDSQARQDAVEHGSTSTRGGARAVKQDETETTPVTVTIGPLEGRSGFYVEDDGPGIPPDDRERVFEYGYSTTDDGTGFGLEIVATIVEAHGWSITATESESGGARFEIETNPQEAF